MWFSSTYIHQQDKMKYRETTAGSVGIGKTFSSFFNL
jgi:hypothetical protein